MSTPATEEARELAKRWADKCDACKSDRNAPDANAECTDIHGRDTKPLWDSERKRLYAWVRERVADWLAAGVASGLEKVGDDAVRAVLLMHVAQDLLMPLADCEALIDAAKGWPS